MTQPSVLGIVVPPASGGSSNPYATGLGLLTMTLAAPPDGTTAYTLTSGLFVAVLAPFTAGQLVSKVGCVIDTSGVTASGTNEMALYSVSGNTATQLGVSGDMSATFTSAPNTYVTGTLGTPVTIPSTGLYYVTALTHFSGTAPKILGSATGASTASFANIKGHFPSVFIAAQASSPATFDASAATRNSAAYLFTAE